MDMGSDVKVWQEEVLIPTYEAGEADKNPMFLDKRVYQGSSGKVYPYPVVEKIADEKKEKVYQAVYLENEYIKVMILPELGGRIQRAYDKTNNYDFVYYNHVIKPALVGLTGPWISGGIEFNWPQHHRPTTFLPTDAKILDNKDGSKSVLLHDVDRMYGTKGIAKITLYQGKAYIEIKGQLYNRTNLPQTFLWWANPAVPVNENTRSIFPPDVHAVMDHGKRDVSAFPIAKGTYYKHDYSEGVDISRYKNIPVPTSYMAEKSEFDFVGGYDEGIGAGILHVADHHISPGKKQWTWGSGDFGQAWDDNLTDGDGPYIELMTGVYTDNQPDFTWLKPFEEKTFTQYFMPYKEVGQVKNATKAAAVNMEAADGEVRISVYATSVYENAQISLYRKEECLFKETARLSPTDVYKTKLHIVYESETELTIVAEALGEVLAAYTPPQKETGQIPEPAQAAREPEEIHTNEELFLTGQHLEQYRHATYDPKHYYLEGLRRDPMDSRINNAYGLLLLRQGLFLEAETHFRKAIARITWKNPNPYNSEAYYNLGLVLFYLERKEAYDAFYKATWSNEQQEMSFYYLAAILAEQKKYAQALEMIEQALVKNSHNVKARGLKAVLLRKLNKIAAAKEWVAENLELDGFDMVSCYEEYLLERPETKAEAMSGLFRGFEEYYLLTAIDYAEGGFYEEALSILKMYPKESPMPVYYAAFYEEKLGHKTAAKAFLEQAEATGSQYCFPNKLEDIAVLCYAIGRDPKGAKAPYYLGLLLYDKGRKEEAGKLFETSAALADNFPTVFRNLALVSFNTYGEKEKARGQLEKAFALDTGDARVFLELDQLYKKLNIPLAERLLFYEKNQETVQKRDDLVIEYITLLNSMGDYEKAYEWTMSRHFHPWEGGEGKITTQYTVALTELAKKELAAKHCQEAVSLLEKALRYPGNLGEGKLEGNKDNPVYYYLGCAWSEIGEAKLAADCFEKASRGNTEPAGMMYYNDQPADGILYQGLARQKLFDRTGAAARFHKLIDYALLHMEDEVKIEYFAVSLPDFLIFNSDLNVRNKVHCNYLLGLGYLGSGDKEKAGLYFREALSLDSGHQNCLRYLKEGI